MAGIVVCDLCVEEGELTSALETSGVGVELQSEGYPIKATVNFHRVPGMGKLDLCGPHQYRLLQALAQDFTSEDRAGG